MIVLDTTVLVYAVGIGHPAKEPSRRLLEAVGDGRIAASTTPEVIQEFVHVYARRRTRAEAAGHGRSYMTLLAPLLVADGAQLEVGLRLYERHEQLGAFDALLAAVALGHGARALVSADAGFGVVPRLSHVMPQTPELERLLSAS